MAEINLLRKYPRIKRDVMSRTRNKDVNKKIAQEFERDYFDGTREQGYGGYVYDGRWLPIARDFVEHYRLAAGDRVLEIGCAKGFFIKDLMTVCPGLEVFGVDISRYAVVNCEKEVVGRVHLGDARDLKFPDKCFKLVISINTIHNLSRPDCIIALKEMQRVTFAAGYVQVDAYRNAQEKMLFEDWMLTAKTYKKPSGWIKLFSEAGYTGDYFWTICE